METTYAFLDILGLDESALERDIRRAYARKLKQIDQEQDPGAFQALRDAYEVALDWARWKLEQEAADVPEGMPADAQDVPAPPLQADAPAPAAEQEAASPAQLGADVYHRFLAAAGELVQLPKHGEVAAWRAAIEARFGDEELVNIDARIYFEAYIASLLVSGWRPGHEVLFVAAQEAFGWTEDRRGLRQLGQAGRMLDQAIEERRLFEAQQPTDRARMRDLVKLLRQDTLPATRRIRAAMPDVERMLARFPAFMEVHAHMENVERWRAVYRESGGPPIEADSDAMAVPPPAPEPGFFARNGARIFILLVIVLAGIFSSPGKRHDTQRPASFPRFYQDSGAAAIPDALRRKTVPPVYYTPEAGKDVRDLEVVFKVFLNLDGRVERVQNWQTSGNPAFDSAVERALMASSLFPPTTPREFEVRYTGEMTRRGEAPASQLRRNAGPPPPAPLTLAMLRKHLGKIAFKPASDAKAGEYKGNYKVMLDAVGKVSGFEVEQSSGLVQLDQAVEKAVRKAKPFAPGTQDFHFTYGTTIFYKEAPKPAPSESPAPEPAPEQ
jgi:protein TonB